jgi:hypothetical protein
MQEVDSAFPLYRRFTLGDGGLNNSHGAFALGNCSSGILNLISKYVEVNCSAAEGLTGGSRLHVQRMAFLDSGRASRLGKQCILWDFRICWDMI